MNALAELFQMLEEVPDNVDLRVGRIGTDGNICLDFIHKGDPIGACSMVEITPDGRLIKQETQVERTVGAFESLQQELDNAPK